MKKIKYLFKKLKEHKEELGFFGVIKWLLFAVKFRTLLFLGRVKDTKSDGNIDLKKEEPGLVTKDKRQRIFIFAGIPFYDIGGGQRGAQLTRTFNSLGYEVYYFFGHDSSESKIYRMEIPTVMHKKIDDLDLEVFSKLVRKDDLVIVEFPDTRFVKYLKAAHSKKAKIVYENIDNWETSLGAGLFTKEDLFKIIKMADVLVGTAKLLVKQLKKYCKELNIEKKILYEANAVDDALFNIHKKYQKPEDFIDGEKTLIYYGSLWGEWFDWNLVNGIAKKFPTYSILLIGEYKNLGPKVTNVPENVHFLGIKKQSDLPAYLCYSDFALLPFKVDQIGETVSPLKIFEYLAMGKAVLSTKLPEVVKYPNIIAGNTVEEWAAGIKEFKSVDVDASMKFVGENNWFCRCTDILLSTGTISKKVDKQFYKNISVVILNYNNMNCIFECIDSLLRYGDRYKYEIIVVDNNSTDGSYEKLKKEYSDKIKLIRNEKNGCSSGRNLGINAASHEFIMMLDSDQFALNNYWLDCHLYIMQKYSKTVGAIGWAAGFVRTSKHGTAPIVDYYPYRYMPANGLYRTNIHYLGSGGMFAKVAVLKKAGLFDEIYDPTCYEDTDLSFAIRNLKYNIAYSPYLGVYHIPHQTTKNGEIDHNSMLDEHEQIFLNKWKNINPDLLKK